MKVRFCNRMKSNIVGMEANMEHLLEKACALFFFPKRKYNVDTEDVNKGQFYILIDNVCAI